MYIINRHGILHDIPDEMPMPKGARKASKDEIAEWRERDAAGKAVLLAEKQEAARRAAQLVVMAAPVTPAPEPAPEPKGKSAKDDK